MGSNIGKISVLPKDINSAIPSQDTSLRKQGYSRFPGTRTMKFPYKELDGRYRTGLDENARYLNNIQDETVRNQEKQRIKKLREKLEAALGVSLAPNSSFWKVHVPKIDDEPKATGVSLIDGDNLFNLDVPLEAVAFAWLKVHPSISPSIEAYNRGDVPADTQFFVNDEGFESTVTYNKKKAANDAIVKLNAMSIEKRKKVGRLLDLPISEDTQEETVYNMLDTFLKEPEILQGIHRGADPVRMFSMYVELDSDTLDVKDLVEQAFKNQLYRVKKGGKVYEGEQLVYDSKDELTEHLLNPDNQADRLALEKKLRVKKLASV